MSSTGGMGRGSDTRMYSPRSESSHMYSANEGEEKYNPVDPKYKEWEKEKKLREDDEKQEMKNKIKHIKILGHHGKNGVGEPESPEEADTELDPRKDLQNELSRQTGPPGNRGHELDLATGAKTGTGSAMGHRVMTGEPMDAAWSELLKDSARYVPEDNPEEPPKETVDLNRPRIDEMRPFAMMDNTELAEMMMQLESMNRHGLHEEAQPHI